MRVRRRGVRNGTRLVRRYASREPVVLCAQAANDRLMRLAEKLGFTEVGRFDQCDTEQWFGVWSSVTPSAMTAS